jgi:glutamate formiminotransferase
MKLVECVPNISDGRRPEVYEAVARAAASVPGVTLLNVDPGAETNRTVITFVGEPEAVLEGAFRLAAKAVELIDMSAHHGAHPRIGAVDVVPFVRRSRAPSRPARRKGARHPGLPLRVRGERAEPSQPRGRPHR